MNIEKARELLKEFEKDQCEALLSMDKTKIREFIKKYYGYTPDVIDEVFWGGVHKAITGQTKLPIEFRRKSKAWLNERGFRSYDDGDL